MAQRCEATTSSGGYYRSSRCGNKATSEETVYNSSYFTEPTTVHVCGTHRNVIRKGGGFSTINGYFYCKRSQEHERAKQLEHLKNAVWFATNDYQRAVDNLGGDEVVNALRNFMPVLAKTSDVADNQQVAYGFNLIRARLYRLEELRENITAAQKERDEFLAKGDQCT